MPRGSRGAGIAVAALAALLSVYASILVSHASRAVGGSDSSGCLNEARGLAAGRAVDPVDPLSRLSLQPEDLRLFIPLGYAPGPRPGTMSPVYPVGLPLHFVAAASLFGWASAPYFVSPLAAVVSLLLISLIARELGLSPIAGLACAVMLAVTPVLVFQGLQPMSDVVATAWALVAVLFGLRSRRASGWGAAAGFAFGVGVLVRPSSAVLILPLVFAVAPNRRAWSFFLLGGAPCLAVLFAFNRSAYGGIFKSGYDDSGASSGFSLRNVAPGARHYGYWLSLTMSPLILPCWIAGCLRSALAARDRLLLFTWFGALFLLYVLYFPYDEWWYTRFLLPGIPALLLASAALGERLLALRLARARLARRTAVLIAFVVICAAGIRVIRRERVLEIGRSQAVFPETIRWASARVPSHAFVFAMEFSGAMKAYGWGTPVRWDLIEKKDFPALRRRLESDGGPLYALMLPEEVTAAAEGNLSGTWKYLGHNGPASLWELEP